MITLFAPFIFHGILVTGSYYLGQWLSSGLYTHRGRPLEDSVNGEVFCLEEFVSGGKFLTWVKLMFWLVNPLEEWVLALKTDASPFWSSEAWMSSRLSEWTRCRDFSSDTRQNCYLHGVRSRALWPTSTWRNKRVCVQAMNWNFARAKRHITV